MREFQRTAIAIGVARFVLVAGGATCALYARAQETNQKDDQPRVATVVVVGQRGAPGTPPAPPNK